MSEQVRSKHQARLFKLRSVAKQAAANHTDKPGERTTFDVVGGKLVVNVQRESARSQ
jgi:hypothetical protein